MQPQCAVSNRRLRLAVRRVLSALALGAPLLPVIAAAATVNPAAAATSANPGATSDTASAAAPATDAASQSDGSRQLTEVVVTAQRRKQLAIKAPLAITALSGTQLQSQQLTDVDDLQALSPGIRDGETNGVNRLFIRGIGLNAFASGAESSTAFYQDGLYIGRPSFQLTDFFDVDRIEVLRGPQSILYGRNATAGAVNVISRAPTDELSGYLDETAGNYNLHQTQGALSGPLTPDHVLLGRIAFDLVNRSGYGWDEAQNHPVNNANEQSVRGTLELKPSDALDIKLIGFWHHEGDNDYYTMAYGPYPGATLAGLSATQIPAAFPPYTGGVIPAGIAVLNSQNAATDLAGNTNHRSLQMITMPIDFRVNDNLALHSVTGWLNGNRHNGTDSENTSAGLGNTFYNERSNEASEEAWATFHTSRWDVVGGADYYHERVGNYVLVPFAQFGPSVNYIQQGQMPIKAYAAYAQATYSILQKLRLTAGGRYSEERRTSTGSFASIAFMPSPVNPLGLVQVAPTPIDQGKTWSDFTPMGRMEYDFTENTLAYFSYTQGFKSGTFNVGQINPPIDPEKITSYELGAKSLTLNGRLELTGAGFYYNYTNLQVNKIIGIATVTTNAAAAKVKGVEMQVRARPVAGLGLDGSLTYLNTEFTSFYSINSLTPALTGLPAADFAAPGQNLSGNMLPGAPKLTADAGFDYTADVPTGGSVTGQADASYASRIFFSEFNDPVLSQSPVTKINASLRYDSADGKWYVGAWGKNLTNRLVWNNKALGIQLWGYPIYGSVDPPRTFGVTAGVKF
jgi:iron complex outermembrane recepter protein